MKKREKTRAEMNHGHLRAVITGTITGILTMLAGILVAGAVIYAGDYGDGAYGTAALILSALSGLLGGIVAGGKTKSGGFLVGIMTGGMLLLVRILVGIALGQGAGVNTLWMIAATLLAALVGGVIGMNLYAGRR